MIFKVLPNQLNPSHAPDVPPRAPLGSLRADNSQLEPLGMWHHRANNPKQFRQGLVPPLSSGNPTELLLLPQGGHSNRGGCCSFGVSSAVPTGLRGAQLCPAVLESRMGGGERQMLAGGSSLLHLVQEFIGKSSGVCKSKWLETGGADTVRTLRHLVIGVKIL